MDTNNENHTMSTTNKTFKPIRIAIDSRVVGFENCFQIDFKVVKRSAVREVAKYLMGLGYMWMRCYKDSDCVRVYKNASFMFDDGRVPLTTVGLERMMGYAA